MPVSAAIGAEPTGPSIDPATVGSATVRYGGVDPAELAETCGPEPSYLCREVLERTSSTSLAATLDFLLATPLTIGIIVLVAWIAVRVLDRAIAEFVAKLSGSGQPTRRLKRRLRRTPVVASTLREGTLQTGAVSIRAAARAETLGAVLRSVASFIVWGIAIITILGELGVNLGPLIATAGIAGVALGFGAQSLVKDFLAGIFIVVEDQYGVGDIIDVGEISATPVSGVVESVSLRCTRLRSTNGTVWHVPNGTVLRVGNMSQQWARALLDVSVAYGSDVDLAQAVIKRAADAVWQDPAWADLILEEPELWGVENLAPEGVTIRLVVKTQPAEQFRVLRELRGRIMVALDEAGIDIATTQRTLVMQRDRSAPTPAPADDPGSPT
jgi:small-conductance mechanosensitive channel